MKYKVKHNSKMKSNLNSKSKSRKTKKIRRNKKKGGMISTPTPRRSTRKLPPLIINVLNLGNGSPESPNYGNKIIDEDEIITFVKTKIDTGYQLVCLPMPPFESIPAESHSIIVKLSEDKDDVMIVDWGGEQNRYRSGEEGPHWINYITLINNLEKEYHKLEYYDINNVDDEDIYKLAKQRCHDNNGQGGCSEYVHNWIIKYIGQGKNSILFKNK
jgi:hypothetical protein